MTISGLGRVAEASGGCENVGMFESPALLFVYGTLRPVLAHGRSGRLISGLRNGGTATAKGVLYDLGSHPGMVSGDGIVQGDLLEVVTAAQLAAFDAYEACGGPEPLYVRERTAVVQADGREVCAWVYLYARPITTARLIPGGDYAADLLARGRLGE